MSVAAGPITGSDLRDFRSALSALLRRCAQCFAVGGAVHPPITSQLVRRNRHSARKNTAKSGGAQLGPVSHGFTPSEGLAAMSCLKSALANAWSAVEIRAFTTYFDARFNLQAFVGIGRKTYDPQHRLGNSNESVFEWEAGSCITLLGRSACQSILQKMQ